MRSPARQRRHGRTSVLALARGNDVGAAVCRRHGSGGAAAARGAPSKILGRHWLVAVGLTSLLEEAEREAALADRRFGLQARLRVHHPPLPVCREERRARDQRKLCAAVGARALAPRPRVVAVRVARVHGRDGEELGARAPLRDPLHQVEVLRQAHLLVVLPPAERRTAEGVRSGVSTRPNVLGAVVEGDALLADGADDRERQDRDVGAPGEHRPHLLRDPICRKHVVVVPRDDEIAGGEPQAAVAQRADCEVLVHAQVPQAHAVRRAVARENPVVGQLQWPASVRVVDNAKLEVGVALPHDLLDGEVKVGLPRRRREQDDGDERVVVGGRRRRRPR
eukprot:3766213-Prymnesium_polylepis.1